MTMVGDNDSACIPVGGVHRLPNDGRVDLSIAIARLVDAFGRAVTP